ncbi:MAG: H-NS family nucleoid-associated regulatory protein [Dakarella massiliensis]
MSLRPSRKSTSACPTDITLEELGATGASKTKSAAPAADQQPKKAVKRVKVSPKYQSEDGLQTWTGRGLKPKWLKAELDAGRKLEDFLIKTIRAVTDCSLFLPGIQFFKGENCVA